MSFNTSWICRFCRTQRTTTDGSKFVWSRGYKVRKCAECVAAEKEAGK